MTKVDKDGVPCMVQEIKRDADIRYYCGYLFNGRYFEYSSDELISYNFMLLIKHGAAAVIEEIALANWSKWYPQ